MAKKTIYVRDGDAELWAKAEAMIGEDSLSGLLATALRAHLEREGTKAKVVNGMKRIVVDTYDDERLIRKAFTGTWLVEGMETGEDRFDIGWRYSVASTQGGQIALYAYKGETPGEELEAHLNVYESIQHAAASEEPEDILAAAAAELGDDFVQELDI